MNPRLLATAVLLAISAFAGSPAMSQATVGLKLNDSPSEGLVLFGPNAAMTTYLINNDGLVVNSWSTPYRPGRMGYMLDNGHLLRAAELPLPTNFTTALGAGGRLEEYDWDGTLLWGFDYSSDDFLSHHDVEVLPNGNVLMIAWVHLPRADAITEGKNPTLFSGHLWIDRIIEVEPTPPTGGNIVWEWYAGDHVIQDFDPTKNNFGVVGDQPELIDINFGQNGQGGTDWTHFNGIDYNSDFDQIVISVHGLNEIWIIDHSTTTAEAAGHTGGTYGKGGDLLYRWGNPQAYRRGTSTDRKLFGQHDSQWIPAGYPGAGNILIYNNGLLRPAGSYSTIEEIVPPAGVGGNYPPLLPGQTHGPVAPTWTYVATPVESFFSLFISGVERQINGNTLICEGLSGHFFEVEPDGDIVWDYVNPVVSGTPVNQGTFPSANAVFKIRRYPSDSPGFTGRDLTPVDPIEGFTAPLPAPEGSLVATRISPDGSLIDVEWDAFSCPSFDYNLIYGDLLSVSSYSLTGAECAIGVTGGYLWTGVPGTDLFFMVVGTDDTSVYESSWGFDSEGTERFATKASFQCGTTTKIVTSTCP